MATQSTPPMAGLTGQDDASVENAHTVGDSQTIFNSAFDQNRYPRDNIAHMQARHGVEMVQMRIGMRQGVAIDDCQLEVAFAAASASQTQELNADCVAVSPPGLAPSVRQGRSFSVTDIEAWLAKTREERNKSC